METQEQTGSLSILHFFRGASRGNQAKLALLALMGVTVIAMTVLSVILIFKWSRAGRPAPVAAAVEKAAEEAKAPAYAFPYELNDISVAVSSRDFSRTAYVQFSMALDCPSAEARRLMELNRARLLDVIFEVSSDFRIEDFTDGPGLKRFKSRVEKKYRKAFMEGAPRQIAIKDWLVQ